MYTSVCCFETLKKKQALQRSLFWQWGIGGEFTCPQPRFLPRKGLSGSLNLLSYSADMFHISHGSTSTLVALPNLVTTSLDNMSAGLLWLGTLSIQSGKLNSDSISNIEFKSLSLSVLADQLLRKAPRTDSLSVKRTILWIVAFSCQHLKAHKTANISSSCMIVRWPLETIASTISFSTLALKNDGQSPCISMMRPPIPL